MRRRHRRSFVLCLVAGWLTCNLSAQDAGDALRRGVSLFEASRPREAEEIFQIIGENHADYAEARTFLGYAFLQRSALDKARRAFGQALAKEPDHAFARLGLGIALLRSGETVEASRQFESILWHAVVGRQARAQHIQSLLLQGLDNEALERAEELVDQYPSISRYRATLGPIYQKHGLNHRAVEQFRIAVELDPQNLNAIFSLVAHFRSIGDWQEALHWARRALEIDPNHPVAFQELSRAARSMGETDLADSAQSEAERTYRAERLYTQAALARTEGDAARTEKLLRQCLEENPRLAKAWADLGNLLRGQNRLEEAEACAVAGVEADPSNVVSHRLRVDVLLAMGRTEEALRASQKGLQRGIQDADLHTGMAAALATDGRNRAAAETVLKALEELPGNPDLLSYLGHLQELSGESENALASYDKALKLNPMQVDALLGQAGWLLKQGKPASAAGLFRRSVELNPQHAPGWTGLIDALKRSGDQPGAVKTAEKCLEIDPYSTDCRERLASLLVDAEQFGTAASEYRKLLSDGHSSRSILSGLAFSLMKLGDYEQSFGILERSLNEFGGDVWTHANLGFIARTLGRYEKAILHYRTAHRLSPENPDTAYDLAYTLYLSGNHRAASSVFSQALKLKPGWGLAHFHMALVRWNLKEYGLALAHARMALDLGVEAAAPVVRTLSAYLSLGLPRTVVVRRQKPPD